LLLLLVLVGGGWRWGVVHQGVGAAVAAGG